MEQLGKSEARWQQTATALKRWEEEDITSNQTLWDMEEFENRTIDLETLERLKKNMVSMRTDTEKQHQEAAAGVRELKKQEKQTRDELEKLRSGSKAYPKYLENARSYIQRRLLEKTGKSVDVHVLADLLDVKRDEWRNAVEGWKSTGNWIKRNTSMWLCWIRKRHPRTSPRYKKAPSQRK